MNLTEAVRWCQDHCCSVYFTSNPLEKNTHASFGRVQVQFTYPGCVPHGCGGDTLELATERASKEWDKKAKEEKKKEGRR